LDFRQADGSPVWASSISQIISRWPWQHTWQYGRHRSICIDMILPDQKPETSVWRRIGGGDDDGTPARNRNSGRGYVSRGGKRDTGIVDRDRPCLPRCVATSCIENRVSGELVGDHAYACCLLLLDEQHFERRWMNWDLRVLNPHYLPKCQRACFDFCCFLKSSPLLGSY
jgi:hypothetical protein